MTTSKMKTLSIKLISIDMITFLAYPLHNFRTIIYAVSAPFCSANDVHSEILFSLRES